MSKSRKGHAPTPTATTATPAAPVMPSPSPAAVAGEASTASKERAAAPQAPRLQQTVTDEDLRAGALGAIKDIILGEPDPGHQADNQETPGQEPDSVETPEIITAEDSAEAEDDDGPDVKPDPDAPEPEAAAEDTEEDAATDGPDEDLNLLADKSDEELDTHGKAKGWPASYLKRVKSFTRQLREAQAQAALTAELEQELAAIKSHQADPETAQQAEPEDSAATTAAPSVPVGEEQAMVEQLETLKKAIRRIDASPDGLEVNGQTLSPEQLDKIREDYQEQVEQLRVNLTLHRRDVQQRLSAEHAQVVKSHPWLKQRSNPDTAMVRDALTRFPVLRSIPDGVTMLVEAIEYRRLKAAGKTPTTAGTATVQPSAPARKPAPPARTPARPAAAPLAAPRGAADLAASHKRVMQTGDPDEAKALLAKLL